MYFLTGKDRLTKPLQETSHTHLICRGSLLPTARRGSRDEGNTLIVEAQQDPALCEQHPPTPHMPQHLQSWVPPGAGAWC